MTSKIKVLVEGGKASPGPPLGPALGPLGVNIGQVVAKINEKTAQFSGMKVPVTVIVDKDKKVEVEVGSPPVSSLIKKEIGLEKGAKTAGKEVVGDISFVQVVKIARMKQSGSLARNIRSAVMEVLGTCVSTGVTVDGKDPRDVQNEVMEGKRDEEMRENAG